jgi:hypothetical protein
MRAKGILLAALAGGILLLAPGFEGARADGNHGHKHSYKHSQLQAFKGHGHRYGWHGQRLFGDHRDGGHAYGKRARKHFGTRLSSRDRKKLARIRQRFDNERAFRRHLRNKKPELFGRYMGQVQPRHRQFDNLHRYYRGQVWNGRQVRRVY